MSEPTPRDRALELIWADPKQRLAFRIGYCTGLAMEDAIAAYLLLAETPPEPAKVWTAEEAQTLFTRAQRIADAKDQLANVMLQLHFRDLDPTTRAATEGALNVACAKLAALVGGAR